MEKHNQRLSEIKRTIYKWPINYKNIEYETVINRSRITYKVNPRIFDGQRGTSIIFNL